MSAQNPSPSTQPPDAVTEGQSERPTGIVLHPHDTIECGYTMGTCRSCSCECSSCWLWDGVGRCLCPRCEDSEHDHTLREEATRG